MSKLIDLLIKHEGLKLKPYICTAGKLTIGVGRNITDNGITKEEAMSMLENDIEKFDKELLHNFEWYSDLSRERQDAMINICFNLGITRLLDFKNALAAMGRGDYEKAADEFLDSKWARQVGNRAIEVTDIIRQGRY